LYIDLFFFWLCFLGVLCMTFFVIVVISTWENDTTYSRDNNRLA